MQTLRMLGGIALASEDGRQVDALLRQPKSVALLAYLASPRPGTWHRRDVLLAMFWGELSQSSARGALRSALSLLRRHLAEGTIRTRGDDDVCVDPARLASDVGELLDAFEAGDHERAIERYGGDFLPALYIADAPEFERWLEDERARLRALAARSAGALADARERAGDARRALDAAARACELAPDDEPALRRRIILLARTGDRTGALAAYERFRSRVAVEFDVTPSPETSALVEEIRRRDASPSVEPALLAAREPATSLAAAHEIAPSPPSRLERSRARRPRRLVVALALLVPQHAIGNFGLARRSGRAALSLHATSTVADHHRLIFLPIEVRAGDSAAYVGEGIAYGVTRRLERLGTLSVRRGTAAATAAPSVPDPTATLDTTVLLRVALTSAGDSLEAHASLIDSASGHEREVFARRVPNTELADVESEIAAATAGAIYRAGVPFAVRHDAHPVDPEAYRLTILGYHQLIALGDNASALRSFVRATQLDPLYARAWTGLASVWGLRTAISAVPVDEGYERTAAAVERALAIDSTQGSALASLGIVTAFRYRNLDAGMALVRRAIAYEPSNPEVFVIGSFMNRAAHRWDDARDLVRMARQLDPLTLHYPLNEAGLELCADRPKAAERLGRDALEREPLNAVARHILVRALARQRRYDDAIEVWRTNLSATAPRALVRALSGTHGRDGYFGAVHAEGRVQLDAYRRHAPVGVPAYRLNQLRFRAGDSAAGFALLDSAVRARVDWTYLLPCAEWLDEVRGTPRYDTLVREAGALPAH
jgi:DNA-binding SARP family transcriptional activator